MQAYEKDTTACMQACFDDIDCNGFTTFQKSCYFRGGPTETNVVRTGRRSTHVN